MPALKNPDKPQVIFSSVDNMQKQVDHGRSVADKRVEAERKMTRKRSAATGRKMRGTALPIVGRQTIENADLLRATLQSLMEREAQPALDLSQVEECDVAALQLFCSAAATLEASGRQLKISSHSPAVVEAIQAFGLQSEALFCSPAPPVKAAQPGNEGAQSV